MKSIKKLPQKSNSKSNGRETRGTGTAKEGNVLTRDQQRNKQRQKKNADGVGTAENVTDVRKQVEMTIHEIRNPLTAISLANQSIQEQIQTTQLPDTAFACTAIIQKNIATIEEMLRDLLTARNAKRTDTMPIDVCFAIENCLCKTWDRIFLKKIEIHKSFTAGLLVEGNAENLSLAFLNIIVNAIEAVKEDEGKIWITAYQIRDGVRVIFKDNGAGMEPDVARRMFEKNFSRKSKGLGVGLTHVKEVLDEQNATVSVNSEPGSGTTIVIEFKNT